MKSSSPPPTKSTTQRNQQSLCKVPFALLANIDRSKELLLNKNNDNSERNVTSRKRERSTDDDVTTGNDNKNTSSSLLGDIDKVKAIGKKTRERLHDERRKRKEIVRLEHEDFASTSKGTYLQNHSTKNSIFATKTGTRTTATKSKRNNKQLSRNKDIYNEVTTIDERKSNYTQIIDSWVPQTQNIMTIYQDLSKDEKSNIVRLHGLPINVTSDNIRKFFSGLSPQRIFILPSLHVTIKDFDLCCDKEWNERTNYQTMRNKYVQRHPNHFRVFVKFSSYLVAENAVSRSGEAIHVDQDIGACIAITPISKRLASHLQKYMAIDVEKGKDLEEVLHEVEHKIPMIVNELIWIMAQQQIGLDTMKAYIGGNGSPYTMIETNDLNQIVPPSSDQRMEKIIILYNKLCDLYDELEMECTPFMMQDVDELPSASAYSSAHHLTKVSSHWILNLLETIRNCLNVYQYQKILRNNNKCK